MSSFIGHSLAGISVYHSAEQEIPALARWRWLAWLMILAVAPDIDYLIPALRINVPETIRITHSLVGCLILPLLTIIVLRLFGYRGRLLRLLGLQAIMAGLSHIVLDLLVGVTPLALFWPFSLVTVRLPFGLLPDAAKLYPANPLLFYNTVIELGVLVPLTILVYILRKRYTGSKAQWALIGGLCIVSIGCMVWAFTLAR